MKLNNDLRLYRRNNKYEQNDKNAIKVAARAAYDVKEGTGEVTGGSVSARK